MYLEATRPCRASQSAFTVHVHSNFSITSMSEVYTGNKDIILELPESDDVYHIDWISVYCYRFGVDFGHIRITNVSSRIPPHVPVQKRVKINFFNLNFSVVVLRVLAPRPGSPKSGANYKSRPMGPYTKFLYGIY